jgi:hypothetical protein
VSPILSALLQIVPDIAERIIDAVTGRKVKEIRLTDILSEIEMLQLRRDVALRRARQSVKRKKERIR